MEWKCRVELLPKKRVEWKSEKTRDTGFSCVYTH